MSQTQPQAIPMFDQFVSAVHKSKPRPNGPFKGRLLSLDPGETTGWSIFDSHDNSTHYELATCGQLVTWDKVRDSIYPCVQNFPQLLALYQPDRVVIESYRVYDWRSDDHKWSDVPTLRIIGSIETRLVDAIIPYSFQTAQVAKQFVTDERLKSWGFYQRGERHARDAIRHALYHITFGIPPSQQ